MASSPRALAKLQPAWGVSHGSHFPSVSRVRVTSAVLHVVWFWGISHSFWVRERARVCGAFPCYLNVISFLEIWPRKVRMKLAFCCLKMDVHNMYPWDAMLLNRNATAKGKGQKFVRYVAWEGERKIINTKLRREAELKAVKHRGWVFTFPVLLYVF